MSYLKIKTLEQLKKDCEKKQVDYFIHLGYARSSKTIEYVPDDDIFCIFNDIDGHYQELNSNDIIHETNIVSSIENGSFYKNEWNETKN